ncbi:MAG: response regulator [Anaeromyxobacter sp.]
MLVADDEPNIRATLGVCLRSLGCEVTEAGDAAGALRAIGERPHALALVDLRLGVDDGLDLLPRLLEKQPDLDVVIITAYGRIESAVEAMRRGAQDYLPKPFTPVQVGEAIAKTRERRAARAAAPAPAAVPGGDFTTEELEREHVKRVVARAPTLAEASRILGLDVTTLWRKRKRWQDG